MLNRVKKYLMRAAMTCITVIAAVSCRHHPNDISIYHDIDPHGWAYDQPLVYDLTPRDSIAFGDIFVSLSHTGEYRYTSLYLEVTLADSLSTHVDTLEITLADPSGDWLGHGIGTDYQISDTIATDVLLHRPAKLSLRHIMRVERLKDVTRVGVSFVEK